MRALEVWLYDELVGRITETRKGGRFSYEENVVDSCPGLPSEKVKARKKMGG